MKLSGCSCIISLLVVSNYFFPFRFMGRRIVQSVFNMKARNKIPLMDRDEGEVVI